MRTKRRMAAKTAAKRMMRIIDQLLISFLGFVLQKRKFQDKYSFGIKASKLC
jgi:hypothetical protein